MGSLNNDRFPHFELLSSAGREGGGGLFAERHPVALRPDQLEQLASALNVSVSDLIGEKEKEEKKRGSGPTGRMKQLFEQANDLPRSQQQKIAAVLEAFITQNRQTTKQKA